VSGYSTNDVLKAVTQVTMNYVEAWAGLHGESSQVFQHLPGYQADGWNRPRRVIAKCEVTSLSSSSERPGGLNRSFAVANLTQPAERAFRQVYEKRGDAPERAIEEFKQGIGHRPIVVAPVLRERVHDVVSIARVCAVHPLPGSERRRP
jgi:hypothetical protein